MRYAPTVHEEARIRTDHPRPIGPSLAACLAPLLALVITSCGKEEQREAPPPEVLVTDVVKRDVPVYGEWVGTLDGFINAQIRAKVQGYLLKRDYQEGSLVKEGDVLFQLDPRQYQAALDKAKANVAQTQAVLVRSEQNVARYRPLVAKGAVSKKELDDWIQTMEANRANVDAALAALDNAKLELDWTTILSPIAGIAGIAQAQVGDLIAPSTLMATVSQVDPIKVYFPISEQEYLRFAARNPAAPNDGQDPEKRSLQLILADGSVYDQSGQVTAINREVEVQTGSLQIQAAFPNPVNRLRPGGYAKVRALIDDRKNALVVPQRAVQEVQGKHQLVVVGKDDVAEIRAVTVGPKSGDFWVIDKGVEAGDRVVVEGLQKARNGTKVAPKPFVSSQ